MTGTEGCGSSGGDGTLLKLLIVDDNDFERNSLKNLIDWGILGIRVVDTAFDGRDALEKARRHHPDIIVSDVKMPVMDGIEMAKKVKAVFPQTKFIFSSGYDDVALLKEALEIRAYNYILKPLNPDELIDTVKKVTAVIADERLSNLESRSAVQQFRDNLSFLQSKFLVDLLLKETPAETIDALAERAVSLKLRLTGDYRLILADLDFGEEDLFEISCRTDTVMGSLQKACGAEKVVFLEIEHNKIAALLYGQNERHSDTEQVVQAMRESLKRTSVGFRYQFVLGVSAATAELTDLNRLFRQCSAAAEKKVEQGYGRVLYFESLKDSRESPPAFQKADLKTLVAETVETVAAGEDFGGNLAEILRAVSSMENSRLENAKNVSIGLIHALSRRMEREGDRFEEVAGDEMDACGPVIAARVIPEIFKYIKGLLEKIRVFYAKNGSGKDGFVVDEVLNILKKEYSTPITLTSLSDRVYLSPNYLRLLFKNKMNISIQDYLTELRIGKAKELLKQSRYKVREIGEMVGYPNGTYFTAVFRTHAGLTPGEYRSRFLSSGRNRRNDP